MNILKKSLAMFMALCMLISIVPVGVSAAEAGDAGQAVSEPTGQTIETNEPAVQAVDAESFMKVFHLDCGRKYFTVAQVKELIDELASVGFSHMQLAIGNDGLRLLLDDMSITANGQTYASDTVKSGIQSGNRTYSHAGEWSEAEMNEIIAYAKSKRIEIIPLVNNPGHMDSILAAMKACGINGNYKTSKRTVDLDNAQAIAFTKELVMKYASYFKSKGCNYFNIGADEYANDYHTSDSTGMGFGALIDNGKYGKFIDYMNDLVARICDLGMTPIAFNDGIYFENNTSCGTFDTRLMVASWTGGWGGIKPATTTFLQNKGHQLLNTNERWYYVIGRASGTYGYSNALANAKSEKVTVMTDHNAATAIGAMQCVWSDDPSVDYEKYKENVKTIIRTLAENNSTYFTGPNPPVEPEEPVDPNPPVTPEEPEETTKTDEETGIAVTAPGLTEVTIGEVEDEAEIPEIEGAEEVLVYDVTLMAGDQPYTGEASISVPVPEDWTNVLGAVLASEHGDAVFGIEGELENGMFTFTAPHFSGIAVYETETAAEGDDVTPTEEVIELKVGDTHQFKVEGKDLRGDYVFNPTGIADVDISYEKVEGKHEVKLGNQITPTSNSTVTGVIKSGDYYLVMDIYGSLGITTEVADATRFTVEEVGWISTSYTIKSGNNYLRYNNGVVGGTGSYEWKYSNGFYRESGLSDYYLNYNGDWTTTRNANPRAYLYETVTTEVQIDESTVTFTGLSAGETYVTIDGVNYKIVVTRHKKSGEILTGETLTFENDGSQVILSETPADIVDATLENGELRVTGTKVGTTTIITNSTEYEITVSRKKVALELWVGENISYNDISGTILSELPNEYVDVTLSGGKLKITGKAIGTTQIATDYTDYTITVKESGYSSVTPLTIEYWITNIVTRTLESTPETPVVSQQISVTANGVTTEEGAELKTMLPEWTIKKDGDSGDERGVEFWHVRMLDKTLTNESESGTEEQTTVANDDETTSGKAVTRVRYYNPNDGKGRRWQMLSGDTWLDVESKNHQIVAYYMEVVEIYNAGDNPELHVNSADWGKIGDNRESSSYADTKNYCSISFQIIYEDGSGNPTGTTAADLDSKTLIFNYWADTRGIGTFAFDTMGQFDIYQITAETGAVSATFTGGAWGTAQVNSLTWDENEKVVWEGESETASIYNNANKPSNADPLDNLMWNENKEAILIRVYVRAKATDDSLNVVYIDERFNETLYDYNIHVHADVDFAQDMIGTPKTMANGRMDVTGCGIQNFYNQNQMFQTDLTLVPEAKGKYDSGLYTYTGSEISEDGKTLYLYYNIDTNVLRPNFVVDFGLPITFGLDEIVTNSQLVQSVTVSARNGDIQYANGTFTYTPTKIMQGMDVISVRIKFDGNNTTQLNNIGVTPATTVHYEESYISWDNQWIGGNAPITVGNQTTESIGDKVHNYGYDPVYANQRGASNGTNAVTTTMGAKGTFTFTGDGIQVFANGTEGTGYVAVEVKNSAGKVVNLSIVNTLVKKGDTDSTAGQSGNMYGLPIVSLVDLQNMAHDTYTVTLTKIMDSKPVRIDGIRVFNTMKDSTIFNVDLEDNPDFYEMRDAVLHALNVGPGTSIDYNKNLYEQVYNSVKGSSALITNESVDYAANDKTPQDLLDNGPKNEVYLYPNNTLTFKVATNRVMQLGMKVPRTATSAEITVDGAKAETLAIGSSVDMFYSLAGKVENANTTTVHTVQIKNVGADILSITHLKICDDPSFKFVPLDENDIKDILADAGHVLPNEKPETTETEVCKIFTDVAHGAWYEDSVQYVYDKGILLGDGETFAPNSDTTRAMVAEILYRFAGSPEVTDHAKYDQYTDLEAGAWYANAVAWALNTGIATGDDYNMLYNPNASVTREQLALFLWRYAQLSGEDVTVTATEEELFGEAYVNEWAKEGFAWAVERGIIKGAEATDAAGNISYNLNPQGGATRAQFARMLHRYLEGVTE